MVSILIGIGACKLVGRSRDRTIGRVVIAFCLLSIPACIAAPTIAKRLKVMTRPRKIPYRDDYNYFLSPWKMGDRGAEKFADETFSLVKPDALVIADSTTSPPLLLTQEVKIKRPDVKIVSSVGTSIGAPQFDEHTVDRLLAERAVYVVSPTEGYCPDFLLERCTFQETWPLWLAIPK